MRVVTRDSVTGEAVPVHNAGGAVVGELTTRGDGRWLEKWGLDPEIHQLHTPPAWATDENHLAIMREHGAKGLRLHTVDGATWSAPLDSFDRFGIEFCRGHGRQVALPLKHWDVSDPRRGRQLGFSFGDSE